MTRNEEIYTRFLEEVVLGLLAERQVNGRNILDRFDGKNQDGSPTTFSPYNVVEAIGKARGESVLIPFEERDRRAPEHLWLLRQALKSLLQIHNKLDLSTEVCSLCGVQHPQNSTDQTMAVVLDAARSYLERVIAYLDSKSKNPYSGFSHPDSCGGG